MDSANAFIFICSCCGERWGCQLASVPCSWQRFVQIHCTAHGTSYMIIMRKYYTVNTFAFVYSSRTREPLQSQRAYMWCMGMCNLLFYLYQLFFKPFICLINKSSTLAWRESPLQAPLYTITIAGSTFYKSTWFME